MERHIERDRFYTHRITSECVQQLDLGQTKARSPESNPAFRCGWRGVGRFSHQLLPPRGCVIRKLESQALQHRTVAP